MTTKNIFTHDAYETDSRNNHFVSQTTPSNINTICEVTISKYIVPIIFIPGIMGSNLVNGKAKVWFPPNKKAGEALDITWEVLMGFFRSSSSRQKRLDPKNTQVSNKGKIYIKGSGLKLTEEQARQRGWGTIWWSGYGSILVYLEKHLNDQLVNKDSKEAYKGTDEWSKIVNNDPSKLTAKVTELTSKWKLPSLEEKIECLTMNQFEKMGHVDFPVYACGYNWLQSNEDSARLVIKTMQDIKNKHMSGKGHKFLKFIILTHSMGGLVARSIVQQGTLADDLGGVIHGVMPASGAPAVYQRIVNGWDGMDVSGKLFSGISATIFGHTSKRLTAVLANSPGALQLLPFGNFRDKGRTDWITIQSKAQTVKIPITNDNPYDAIYKKQGVWWEMINPKLIDPAGNYTEYLKRKLTASISEVYHFNIDIVKKFHTKIADSYHPNSYAHYAADDSHKANGEIIWTADESAEELKLSSNLDLITLGSNIQGGNEGKPITYSMNKSQYSNGIDSQREVIYQTNPEKKALFKLMIKPISPGDGTVCYQSGEDVRAANRKLKQTYIINGYEHSESYSHSDVQLNSIYCIAQILNTFIDKGK